MPNTKVAEIAAHISDTLSGAQSRQPFVFQEEPVDETTPLGIPTFAPETGLHLLSYCSSQAAPDHFAPKLVHGTDFLEGRVIVEDHKRVLALRSCSQSEDNQAPEADALLILGAQPSRASRVDSPIRVGIRTADCLTWVAAGTLQDRGRQPRQLYLLAHLGWRSLAAGLHWKLARRVAELDPEGAFWKSAWHYLSPAIDAADYPCRWEDVGFALESLSSIAENLLPEAARIRKESPLRESLARAIGRQSDRCQPDLRSLTLADLLCFGALPERIVNHKVNTARSLRYPGHRRFVSMGQASRKRLLTLLEI